MRLHKLWLQLRGPRPGPAANQGEELKMCRNHSHVVVDHVREALVMEETCLALELPQELTVEHQSGGKLTFSAGATLLIPSSVLAGCQVKVQLVTGERFDSSPQLLAELLSGTVTASSRSTLPSQT